ncbi:PadR family transcriptional regulator [Ktedonosporobacter rubrisoli]|uniref:PadR family transcriptional regulator n=1 Tax=Ktedonosporobacter rubrisoli TaxID=2509675 RepID=A0A4P6JKZ2_KTERU|nr:PadR family transcriptional regulator [Ktedonosporobacter rubrisoli]QBD75849.1 PadR family transcriptional regulator [Ktedonosporobacter rubrisoli]
MAKRKVSNLLALAILSLLCERPMHPYEISAVMRQRELSAVIKLNYGSLYSVIEALQRDGLVKPVGTQREGRYPERTVYETTAVGRTELASWLRSLLGRPATEYSQFAAALAFMGNLAPAEVAVLLAEHTRHLQEDMSGARSALERASQLGVDRLFLVEDLYALAQLETRLTFLRQLIQEINDGSLTEIKDGKQVWKISHPELALLGSETEEEPEKTNE